ncbi:MAG: RHS repeat-associated core domain-containing protein, partial [Kiritimatiellae bacterium]|nr:RHS repeat-associated core domain-containing protein [Kiritimatiellia bacterium]
AHAYTYDDLSRPTARTSSGVASSFAYNDRSEVVSAQIGTNLFTHVYDYIGNQTLYAANAETNVYTHNVLNQIETVTLPQASALDSPFSISYDVDGNLVNDSVFVYLYDSENCLTSVSSASLTNGAIRVVNAYDYRNRRTQKTVQHYVDGNWQTTEYRVFVYDGWNLIYENVCEINGATTNTTEIQYFWGIDLSETFQGAGGVGGLLSTSINGQFYLPTYDNNGNVTKYIDENGNVVASYEYDDFGRIISLAGSMANFFCMRFSTKYFDYETGLYYYGYRFYSPVFMRWLNRDPIEEEGGENLYRFCSNNSSYANDYLGLKWKISRNPSKRWAVARKTSDSDTIYDLATQLRLDVSESDRWMKQLGNDKCAYEIPNVFCVYTSKSKWGDGVISFVTHLKKVAVSDAKRYRGEGFMVVSHEWANSEDSFCSMWNQDGIYAISFAGHGSKYGFIADNSSGMAIGPDAVYPPYRLAAVRAYSCLSSAEISGNAILSNGSIPKYSWKNHVSASGIFIGYSGGVNWLSQFWQKEAINE